MAAGPEGLRLALALVVYGVVLALFGQLALIIAPLPIAVAMARGQGRLAGGYLGTLVVVGVAGPVGALGLLVSGALGAAAGWGMRRRLAYSGLVIGVAALAVGLNALSVLVQWDETVEEVNSSYEELGLHIEDAVEEGLSEQTIANLRVRHWLLGHWDDVYLGMTFSGMLVLACMVVGATAKWLSLRDKVVPSGAFMTFRPSDWLVWLLIGAALLWYADYRWPAVGFRFLSWNAGFAIAGVYWLDGLAILMYAVAALRPNALVLVAIVASLVLFGLAPLLAILGLFDTWGDFRPRLDRFLEKRKSREDSHDDMA